MKAFINPTMLFLLLLLSIFVSIDVNIACAKDELWNRHKDGCNQGMYKQPNGPMSLILFCNDALGTYIGLVYYDDPEGPASEQFYNRLSESEKVTYYKVWSLSNRMWQDSVWASDVTSYAWGPDGTKLYVATSGIYGSGALYELDLIRKKHKQIAPVGKIAKLDGPGPGYVIMRMAREKNRLVYIRLVYILEPQSDERIQGQKELFYKFE